MKNWKIKIWVNQFGEIRYIVHRRAFLFFYKEINSNAVWSTIEEIKNFIVKYENNLKQLKELLKKMITKKGLMELQAELWRTQCETGFDKEAQSFERFSNLVKTEIAEAYKELEKGRSELYFAYLDANYKPEPISNIPLFVKLQLASKGNKPEGEYIELADVLIRILNFCGINKNILWYFNFAENRELPDEIVIDGFYSKLFTTISVENLINNIIRYLRFHDQNWIELIQIKNTYNKTREFMHGKKF